MRVEGSVTTISWVPAEAVERDAKTGFRLGTSRADPAPPADLGPDIDTTLDALADRYRFANHLRGFAEFDDDGEVRRYGEQGSGRLGHRTGARGRTGDRDHPHARAPGRAGGRSGLGALRPDVGRPHGVDHGEGDASAALRALQRPRRMDDARAHAARRRAGTRTAGRRVALPAPLGLRRGRSPRRDERHHGLEGLGRFSSRDAYAVGRRGLAGLRHRGRVGVGAGAGRDAVARHTPSGRPPAAGR